MNLQAKLIKIMLIPSLLFHFVLFWLLQGKLGLPKASSSMKYFVSIVELPGGGGSGGGGIGSGEGKAPPGKMRELQQVSEQVEKKASLTYPVKKKTSPRRRPVKKNNKRVIVKSRRSSSEKSSEYSQAGDQIGAGEGGSVSFGIGSGSGGVGFGGGSAEFNFGAFPFPFYLVTIRDKIALNWYRYFGGRQLGVEIIVYFKVGRQGQLLELKLEKSCGVRRIDEYALKAVEKSSPFPPLPKAYDGEYLAIRVIFE